MRTLGFLYPVSCLPRGSALAALAATAFTRHNSWITALTSPPKFAKKYLLFIIISGSL